MTDLSQNAGNSVVSRYTRSLHEVSVSIKKETKVLHQMRSIKEYVLSMESHKKALKKGSLLLESGLEFVNRLKKELKLSPEVSAFLDLLRKNKRLTMIIEMCNAYISLADKENSKEIILVTYAKKFPKNDEKKLLQSIEALGRQMLCVTRKDPALIAGVKIQYRSKILDYSIKSKLDRLCNAITGNVHEN